MTSLVQQFSDYSSVDGQTKIKSEVRAENIENGGNEAAPVQPMTDLFKGQDIQRSDTPETFLTDYTYKPDITLPCDQCRVYIDIRHLKHHRDYHKALLTLNYKGGRKPQNLDLLLKKRNAAIHRLKKQTSIDSPIEPKQIQLINEAYELLKADLEDTFEVCRQVREHVDTSCQTVALTCSPGCALAVGISSSANKRWNHDMEDTHVYQDCFGQDASKCYLGLFDGYHGHFSAEVAASLLHKMFLHELCKSDKSLKETHVENYSAYADIAHHSFVFGPDSKLDLNSSDERLNDKDKCQEKSKATYNSKHLYENGFQHINIHQDDDEMTQHIIQLCEEKYDKLQIEFPSSTLQNTLKSTDGKREKAQHPQAKEIAKAFDKSYHLLDILLSYGKDEWSKVRWSGCSALTVVIESLSDKTENNEMVDSRKDATEREMENTDDKKNDGEKIFDPPKVKGYIHLANAGSVRAVLVRGNRAYRLSRDHTPDNPKERDRVIKAGGTITSSSEKNHVNGVLSTTRGLGNHGDFSLKKCVLVEPYATNVVVDQYAQFLVLGTNGIWDIFSDQEVANLLMRLLPANQIPPPRKVSISVAELLGVQTSRPGSELASVSKKVLFNPESPKNRSEEMETGSVKRHSNFLISEKGTNDAAVKEKAQPDYSASVLNIPADLKTEVGSSLGDLEDQILVKQEGNDMLSISVQSHLQLKGQGTVEEKERELAHMMAEHLVQAALLAGAHHNITAMVVLFPGYNI